jgi:hypothetical protein
MTSTLCQRHVSNTKPQDTRVSPATATDNDGIVRPTLAPRPVTQGDVEVVSLGAAQPC